MFWVGLDFAVLDREQLQEGKFICPEGGIGYLKRWESIRKIQISEKTIIRKLNFPWKLSDFSVSWKI